jgi:hypothetical protein
VTTVNYSFNEKGQLIGARVDGGDQNSEVWTDANRDGRGRGGDGGPADDVQRGEHVSGDRGSGAGGEERDDELRGDCFERCIHKITDTGAHGYSRSVTTVDYSFNEKGQLMGAAGRRWGIRTARCGRTRTGTVVDAGEMVDQPTTFSVVNTYRVIVGQAQVVKSVTTSYAATVSNGVFTKITDTGAHGYSRSVTTVNYSFNDNLGS